MQPKRIHILTEGFRSSNGRAFLFPLLKYRKILKRDYGLDVHFYTERTPALNQCDVLMVDSKVYKPFWASSRRDEAIAHFADDYAHAGQSFFVDLNDSTGWVVPYVSPYVTTYLKSQILRDRTAYSRPLYEHRPHSDYYHARQNIMNDQEQWSLPLGPSDIAKMRVGWHSGLAHYGFWGPWLMKAYEKTGLDVFLARPRLFYAPDRPRDLDFSYRFGLAYPQHTLRYQRLQLRDILTTKYTLPTDKLSRLRYFREMMRAKIIFSPFGYGEITLKDFETFLCGAALMKPDMSGIETWPNLFENNVTYIPFSWDLDDVLAQLDTYLSAPDKARAIAEAGQARYRHFVSGASAEDEFCRYFAGLLQPAPI